MTVLVAGAGIGGLSLALSLHQVGVPVRVFESAPTLRALGVGINLLPHAVRELTELGLESRLASVSVATAELAFYTRRGERIWSEPRGIHAGYRWPQFSIHRGTLQMVLFDAVRERLGESAVVTGHRLTGFTQSESGVVAEFETGDGHRVRESGDLLVAADGIHSTVRATLYPDEGPPIWNGAILWRGTTVAQPYLTGKTMIMAGHEFQKFVSYPVTPPDESGKVLVNWIAERKFDPKGTFRREDWNREGDDNDFLPWFEDWRFDWLDVPALIRAREGVYEYPMVDRDPLPKWTFSRVTLLGDAAHPMYPIGSNGASQAILDARTLAGEMQRRGPVAAALEAYEAVRRPATALIVLANRGNGPEQVMQMVEERAPDGFDDLHDVISEEELQQVADTYKQLAGFDRDQLNARASLVTPVFNTP